MTPRLTVHRLLSNANDLIARATHFYPWNRDILLCARYIVFRNHRQYFASEEALITHLSHNFLIRGTEHTTKYAVSYINFYDNELTTEFHEATSAVEAMKMHSAVAADDFTGAPTTEEELKQFFFDCDSMCHAEPLP